MLRRALVLLIGLVTLSSVLATDLWIQHRLQERQLAERLSATGNPAAPPGQGR
jgi:hypothetical protein